MGKELVFFRGTKQGVQIILDDSSSFPQVISRLKEKLESSAIFFVGSQVTINPGPRQLSKDEYSKLEEVFKEYKDLTYLGIEGNLQRVGVPQEEAHLAEIPSDERGNQQSKPSQAPTLGGEQIALARPVHSKSKTQYLTLGDEQSLLIRRTIRSGQSISFPGNVTILGDVNPGAEVIAEGDIIVMGTLRGTAHAGVKGREAVIAALQIACPQLRLGKFVAQIPEEKSNAWEPEIASVKKGKIVISKLRE